MKQITIKLNEEIHKAGKIEAINQNMSFMQYIVNLIQKDLEAKKSKQEKELMRQNVFLS